MTIVCKFRGRNFFRRGECETREKFNFSKKKKQNVNYRNSAGGKPRIFIDII